MKILRVEPEWDDTPRPLKRKRRVPRFLPPLLGAAALIGGPLLTRWHEGAGLLVLIVGLFLAFLLAD